MAVMSLSKASVLALTAFVNACVSVNGMTSGVGSGVRRVWELPHKYLRFQSFSSTSPGFRKHQTGMAS